MTYSVLFGLSALLALVPSSLVALRKNPARDGTFWTVLAVAVTGPVVWVIAQMAGTWQAGLSVTLWVIVAASMVLFAGLAAVTRQAWKLTPLMAPYMVCLGVLAMVWQQAPHRPVEMTGQGGWIQVHIVVSVLTYGLVTVAAVAALAAFLQERALKIKRPNALTRLLPAVVDCDALLVRLLVASEAVLAVGLATGMSLNYRESGNLLAFDHKTVLTIATFLVIGGLLVVHWRSGVRGRMAARVVLLAYLLLMLALPGVKFVTDVLAA